jgi:GT2 family glycosyltransferase
MIADQREDAHQPLLSIVVVNTDGVRDTLACLESIYHHPPDAALEVVLVDNCSQDSCLSLAHRQFPQVRTFSAPERQGFAKNYNLGMHHARGEYLLILNNDTVVQDGALDALLDQMRINPTYSMLGPKLVSPEGQIQPECARSLPTPFSFVLKQLVLDPAFPIGRLWRHYLSWRVSRRPSGPVPCITGACMLVTRAVLETIGLLDESYDFYYEDIEWCHRLWSQDKVVAYVAEAQIAHLGDRSLSRVKVWAMQSEYQSALHYFREYHALGSKQTWLLWIATVVSFHMRALAFLFLERVSGKSGHAEAYVQLCKWILGQRPEPAGAGIATGG